MTVATDAALAARSLLVQRDLDDAAWDALLAASELLAGDRGRRPLLAGLRFAMLFLAPSLRTRTAFEVACHDLGAHAVPLQPGEGSWTLEHRDGVVMDGAAAEHLREAVGVLARMVDGIGLRAFAGLRDAADDLAEPVLAAAARASGVPLLNLESALDHPHQALADALTLRRQVGERCKVVVTWAPHVRPLPMAVPAAAVQAFAREGHDVVLAHPEGFELPDAVLDAARASAARRGGTFTVTHDREAAFEGARVVYAKAWGSARHYGEPAEVASAAVRRPGWMVRERDLQRGDRAFFMHCLPVRRNVVVEDALLDGPRSLVFEQAAARLDVQRATLCRAAGVDPASQEPS
ncbi:MAG: N-acetylornithine carbamoyltransferase [Planctomycetes bacterium]|nr:N-acetylornithine carbamoyltransferase [Planctomycetota bacterium]